MSTPTPRIALFGNPVMLGSSVLLYGAALVAYVLLLMPMNGRMGPLDLLFIAAAALWPVAINLLAGDRARDSGLPLGNLRSGIAPILIFTLINIVMITAVGLLSGGFHWQSVKTLLDKAAIYLAWGPAQQYLLNSFGLRRLRQAGLAVGPAAIVSAAIFAMIHAPNWPLVAVTFLGGVGWCMLFVRWPNILLLGLSQGVLAMLIYHAWPDAWLQRLTIGRMYLHRIGSP